MKHPDIYVKYLYLEDKWELQEEITFSLFDNSIITIPKGFKTDFATVPWYLRWAVSKTGTHNLSCLIHDYLYQTGFFIGELYGYNGARKMSDYAQLEINKELKKVSKLTSYLIYIGSRLGGRKYWDKYND